MNHHIIHNTILHVQQLLIFYTHAYDTLVTVILNQDYMIFNCGEILTH